MDDQNEIPNGRTGKSGRSWGVWMVMGLVSLSLMDAAEARSPHPKAHPRIHHPSSISIDYIPPPRAHDRAVWASNTDRMALDRRKRDLGGEPDSDGGATKGKRRKMRKRLSPDEGVRITFTLPTLRRTRTSMGSTPETIHLHLTPNPDLVHPSAQVHYYSPASSSAISPETFSTLTHSEPLRLDDLSHRGYHGHVLHPSYTFQRLAEDRAGGILTPGGGRSGADRNENGILGWASITLHEEDLGEEARGGPLFEGAFQVDKQVYHVLSRENWERHRKGSDGMISAEQEGNRMVVFLEGDHDDEEGVYGSADADSLENEAAWDNGTRTGCSHDRIRWNADRTHPVYNQPVSFPDLPFPFDILSPPRRTQKRDDISTGGGYSNNGNFIATIGNTAGCPTSQQIVYMGVNADCNYVNVYGSPEAAKTQILTNWNSISALYRSTFNVSLGLIEMNVANSTCPTGTSAETAWNTACEDTTTLDDRLSVFSQWRGTYGNRQAGLYHLMSACPTNTEVGVAWLGTICQLDASSQGQYVSSTGVSTSTKVEWSLISHEIGHNFGAIHDCSSGCSLSGTCCPYSTSACDSSGSYIMNPTTSSSEVAFSPCTEGNICSLMQSRAVDTSCMQTPGGVTILSLQSCGNGIVEDGEDCDPGSGVTSPCCDSATCRFTTDSVCDYTSDLCCTESCSYAANTTVCRPAVDETCDVVEYCTGSNATCPADVVADDGKSCGSDELACASGVCTSLDQQCRQVGVTLNLTEACNSRGDTSCLVTCQSVSSSLQCLVLQSPLLDGSPCGYGGHCYNQTCESGSWQQTAGSWYRSNLNISIPVTIVVGLLAIAILWGLLRCCFCGGRRRAAPAAMGRRGRRGRNGYPQPMMAQQQPYNGPPPPVHGSPYQGQHPPYAANQYSGGNGDGMGMGQYRPQSYAAPSEPPPPWNDGFVQGDGIARPQNAHYRNSGNMGTTTR